MLEDVKIIHEIFSDDEREIYKGLLKKKDWLNIKLIKPVNLDYYFDKNDFKRYPFLENLMDNVLYFDKINPLILSEINNKLDNKNLKNIEDLHGFLNEDIEKFNICILNKNIDLTRFDAPFFVEYDFNKLDEPGYKALIANIYKMHKIEDLEIDFKHILSPINLIKICCIGNEDDYCLILPNESLINGCFFLPIISKIYIAKPIEKDLFKELEYFCKVNNIKMEVIYENNENR